MPTTALYTAEQIRALEQRALTQYGESEARLMTRAGQGACAWLCQHAAAGAPWVVLCGAGNNGGDGYVLAHCAQQQGWSVVVMATGAARSGPARAARARYQQAGGEVVAFDAARLARAGVIVDALLGLGLNRPPQDTIAEMITATMAAHAKSQCPIIALDLPSGLDAHGFAFTPCITATHTITFIGGKVGLVTGDGVAHSGEIIIDDLQLPRALYSDIPACTTRLMPPSPPPRPATAHKGQFGHVVVAGGECGMLGACLLAGRAAMRCGSGMVSVLSRAEHLSMPAVRYPELMSACLENVEAAARLLARGDAIVLGPGLGQSRWSETMYQRLSTCRQPLVVDADGLNWLARQFAARDDWVLTPHVGEAARLLDCSHSEIAHDRVRAATALAEKYGGVCVLKGAGSIVATAEKAWVCTRGNAGMATAGMGDVLAGIIGSLLGQGYCGTEAACAGVWLHAATADDLAQQGGESRLLAGDVAEALALERMTGGVGRAADRRVNIEAEQFAMDRTDRMRGNR